jgi:hypothetical protein
MLWVCPNNFFLLILFLAKPSDNYFTEYPLCLEFPLLHLPHSLASFFINFLLTIDSQDFPFGTLGRVFSVHESLAFDRGPCCSRSLLACQASYQPANRVTTSVVAPLTWYLLGLPRHCGWCPRIVLDSGGDSITDW